MEWTKSRRKEDEYMTTRKVIFTLDKVLAETRITKSELAKSGGIRPNTLTDLTNNTTKAVKVETLERILNTINELQHFKTYVLADLITDVAKDE